MKAACRTDIKNIVILPFDLLDTGDKIEAAAAAANAAFGGAGIDYLINNAGKIIYILRLYDLSTLIEDAYWYVVQQLSLS